MHPGRARISSAAALLLGAVLVLNRLLIDARGEII